MHKSWRRSIDVSVFELRKEMPRWLGWSELSWTIISPPLIIHLAPYISLSLIASSSCKQFLYVITRVHETDKSHNPDTMAPFVASDSNENRERVLDRRLHPFQHNLRRITRRRCTRCAAKKWNQRERWRASKRWLILQISLIWMCDGKSAAKCLAPFCGIRNYFYELMRA